MYVCVVANKKNGTRVGDYDQPASALSADNKSITILSLEPYFRRDSTTVSGLHHVGLSTSPVLTGRWTISAFSEPDRQRDEPLNMQLLDAGLNMTHVRPFLSRLKNLEKQGTCWGSQCFENGCNSNRHCAKKKPRPASAKVLQAKTSRRWLHLGSFRVAACCGFTGCSYLAHRDHMEYKLLSRWSRKMTPRAGGWSWDFWSICVSEMSTRRRMFSGRFIFKWKYAANTDNLCARFPVY